MRVEVTKERAQRIPKSIREDLDKWLATYANQRLDVLEWFFKVHNMYLAIRPDEKLEDIHCQSCRYRVVATLRAANDILKEE